MQRMFKNGVAVAAVVGAAMSASASIKDFNALQPHLLGSALANRGIGGYGTGFEASEGFAQGTINGQNGWLTNAPRGTMDVRDGAAAGNGSPDALRLSKGTQAQAAFGIAQAPPVTSSTGLSIDVKINDDAGANYGVLGFTSAGLSFRVEFDYGGNILLINGSTAVDTGVAWAFNQWKPLSVNLTGTGVEYRYDGNLIGTTPVQVGGTAFDNLQIYHDNYQDIGNTPVAQANGSFDNLRTIPVPGAAALMGLGVLAAGRRRR